MNKRPAKTMRVPTPSKARSQPGAHFKHEPIPAPQPSRKPGPARSVLADFLLNLSEFEIASVQVLSQRLDLLEELQTARAQIRRRGMSRRALHELHDKLRDKQHLLVVAREFLAAMTGRLETEHQKLEALVTTLKSPSEFHRGRHRKSNGH